MDLLTLAAGETPELVIGLLKVLLCAGFVAVVLGGFKLPVIPGYLLAGAIIGPYGIGLLDEGGTVQEIADVALVLLMFGIGLHLDIAGMRRGAFSLIAVGTVSTITSTIVLTPLVYLFGEGVGLTWRSSLAIGMALSLSSTAVVLRLIQQRRELHRVHGRLSFGVLLIQDILVIGMLTLIPTLAESEPGAAAGEDASALEMLGTALLRFGGVAGMLAFGKVFLPPLMLWLARFVSTEVMLVVAASVALGASVFCGWLELSPALGAFIAGFLLASTPFRFQISGQMTPLRDLFMAVFFTAVGLSLDVAGVAPNWWIVLLGLLTLVTIKIFVIAGTAWVLGSTPSAAAQTGINLGQAGEFSLIVIATAAAEPLGLIPADAESVVIAVIVLSLVATPWMMAGARSLAPRLIRAPLAPWVKAAAIAERPDHLHIDGDAEQNDQPPQADLARCPVIIAGYGPVGRAVADELESAQIPVSIVELNTATVRRQMSLGRSIVFGDITNPEVLESAGIHEADAAIITIPDEDAMLRAVKQIRAESDRIFIACRSHVLSRAMLAHELGADHVTVEELATARAMASEVIDKLRKRVAATTPGESLIVEMEEKREAAAEIEEIKDLNEP